MSKKKVTDNDIGVAEKIIALDGQCFSDKICDNCPFKSQCHLSFLYGKEAMWSKKQRVNAAIDLITNYVILNDDQINESLNETITTSR